MTKPKTSGSGAEAGRGAGRPVGSVSTPHSLLRAEMKATANTMQKIRQLIEEQIVEVRKHLTSGSNIPLDDRLKTMDTLTTLAEKLQKTVESGAKYLVVKGEEEGSGGSASAAEAYISKFIGGDKQ